MAWGPDANTEGELEKLSAVRGYFQQEFPTALIRDSYDAARMAQVFRIETNDADVPRDAVIATELLDEYPPEELGTALIGLQVAEHLRSAKGREVLVTSWGVEDKED